MVPHQTFDDLLAEEAVHFDVSGQHYWTTVGTLKNIPKTLNANDRGCFFERILENDVSDTLKIDRDGSTFAWVLNYVRSGKAPIGVEDLALLGRIGVEACFFGLNGLAEQVAEMGRAAEERLVAKVERERKIECLLAQVLEQLSQRSGHPFESKGSEMDYRERISADECPTAMNGLVGERLQGVVAAQKPFVSCNEAEGAKEGRMVGSLAAAEEVGDGPAAAASRVLLSSSAAAGGVYEEEEVRTKRMENSSEWEGSDFEGAALLRAGSGSSCSEDEDEAVRKEFLGAERKVVEMFGLSQPKFSEDVDF